MKSSMDQAGQAIRHMNSEKDYITNRHSGMDLLRILSTMMIVLLHFAGYSGNLLIATATNRNMFIATNVLEALCICGVNIFVIVACYNNIHMARIEIKSGVKRLSKLWAQTVMITIPVCVLLLALGVTDVPMTSILQSILPITTRGYWFVTTFAGLCLLFPLLNRVVIHANTSMLAVTAGILMLIYSIIPTLCEYFGWVEVQHGYSLVWFITLYFCTAVYVRLEESISIPKCVGLVGYFLMSAVIFSSVIVLELLTRGRGSTGNENYIIRNYASIPVALQAFFLFLVCSRLKLHSTRIKKIFIFIANGSLVSYLLHMHPMLKEIYRKIDMANYFPKSPMLFIFSSICMACIISIVSAILYVLLEKLVTFISAKTANVLWSSALKVEKRMKSGISHSK